jgi:PadR family transcriptional regulator PadR
MVSDVRLSAPTIRVLGLLLRNQDGGSCGSEIATALKIASGTLYPLLSRLENAGWCESRWEDIDPKDAGRPRRRFYILSTEGSVRALAALEELRSSLPIGR